MQTCSFPRAQEDNSSQGETNALGKKAKMQTQGNISAPGTGTPGLRTWGCVVGKEAEGLGRPGLEGSQGPPLAAAAVGGLRT